MVDGNEQTQTNENDAARELLGNYRDILEDYAGFATAAQRFADAQGVRDVLNNHIANSTDAYYAEAKPKSAIFEYDEAEGSWKFLSEVVMQGAPSPYIGDTLLVTEDGSLLLADTARGTAIRGFTHLQIRPEADQAVAEFSDEERVGALRYLGQKANEKEVTPIRTRNRFGQESVEPKLD